MWGSRCGSALSVEVEALWSASTTSCRHSDLFIHRSQHLLSVRGHTMMSCSAGGWVCTQAFAVRVHQEVCLDVTVLELLFKTFIVSQGKGTQNRHHFYSVNPIETMKLLHLYLKLAAPACWQAEEDSHQNWGYGTRPRICHGEDCSEPHSYLIYPVIPLSFTGRRWLSSRD